MQQRPTVVHLMRYGQVHNPEGVLYGRLPGFGLSELGHEMAARLAEYWDGTPPTHLRCSLLQRVRETLAPIAELLPQLDVVIDERVTEVADALEGKAFSTDNKALCDVYMIRYMLNPLCPSWGEPYRGIVAQMRVVMGNAAATAGPGGQALVVSHQLPIEMTRCDAESRLLAHDPRRHHCTLVSVTSFISCGGFITAVDYVEPAQDLLSAKWGRRLRVGTWVCEPRLGPLSSFRQQEAQWWLASSIPGRSRYKGTPRHAFHWARGEVTCVV